MRRDLVDEHRLLAFAVAPGKGQRLFAGGRVASRLRRPSR
jgi:hypothetical protein